MAKPRINLSDFDEMLNFEPESPVSVSADNPAMVPQNGGITEMDFDQMESFPNHKFKLYEGQQLADMVYLAPSYLSSLFKKETGQNLSKYIKQYRMEKAKELLTGTNMKIVNISEQVGYPNVSYFVQSFREYFGISPQKFRDQGELS